jgi:hypothetical protein
MSDCYLCFAACYWVSVLTELRMNKTDAISHGAMNLLRRDSWLGIVNLTSRARV